LTVSNSSCKEGGFQLASHISIFTGGMKSGSASFSLQIGWLAGAAEAAFPSPKCTA